MKIKSWVFESFSEENRENIQSIRQMEIPRTASYFLKRMFAEIAEKSIPYFEEKRAIVEKYKENGNPYIPPENVLHFTAELKIIQDVEVEIDLEKMDLNLNDLPEKISTSQIDLLELFFNIKE